jgi:hypothetical protein
MEGLRLVVVTRSLFSSSLTVRSWIDVQLNKRDGRNIEEVVSSWLKSAEITRRRKGEVVRINCLNNLGCGCSAKA